MTDVSAEIRRAATASAYWSSSEVRAALDALVGGASDRRGEWDEDAGERWARVLDNEGVVALISDEIPLIILRSHVDTSPAVAHWHVIVVSAVDANELSADAASIKIGFPELAASLSEEPALLDLNAFSAEELWFASV